MVGKGTCNPTVNATEMTRLSCGGLNRGVCTAGRTCECRSGWTGPHCLVPAGFDPVLYERPEGFDDLEFTGPVVVFRSALWIGLTLLGILLFIFTSCKRRLDGWTSIPDE